MKKSLIKGLSFALAAVLGLGGFLGLSGKNALKNRETTESPLVRVEPKRGADAGQALYATLTASASLTAAVDESNKINGFWWKYDRQGDGNTSTFENGALHLAVNETTGCNNIYIYYVVPSGVEIAKIEVDAIPNSCAQSFSIRGNYDDYSNRQYCTYSPSQSASKTTYSFTTKAGESYTTFTGKIQFSQGTYTNKRNTKYVFDSYFYEMRLYKVVTAQPVTIVAGTGINSVYLSENASAKSGSASGTAFDLGKTVYGFVKLKPGYSAPSGWTLVDSSTSAYRVGSKTVGESGASFGTQNANLITYTITYNLNGGTHGSNHPSSFNVTTDSFIISDPTKTGYVFDGWSGTGLGSAKVKSLTIGKGSINDRTYTANWSPAKYTITYKDQGGGNFTGTHESGYPTTHTYNTATTLKSASRTGYTFGGWFTNSACTGNPVTSLGATAYTSNITLYAKWNVITYSISYDLAGGNVSGNPTSYNIETNSFTLANPTKENHTFDGWSGTGVSGKSNNVTVSKGSIGDRSYVANWTIDIDIVLSMDSSFDGVWDGNEHYVVVTPYDADSGEELTDATIYYGLSENSCTDTDLNNFKYDAAGAYTVYCKVMKDGYTTTYASKTFTIAKADSIIDPTPSVIEGLEYTGLDQELVAPADVDYGTMHYAVSQDNTVIPEKEEFSEEIPTGNLVGTYYVFYESTGDSNHNPYNPSLDDVVEISIARVDRSEAIAKNELVENYLDSLDDRFSSIKQELESVRETFEMEAITEDNITAEDVAQKVEDMQSALSEAKVAVTEQLIGAIGSVVYPDSNDAILEALNYFNGVLNDNEKAMVDADLKDLLNSDKALYDAVDAMANTIANLPSPAESETYYSAVDEAKAAYDSLTPKQLETLQDATDFGYEKKLLDNAAAREVIELIDVIDDVTYDGGDKDSKAMIEEAEAAYAALTDDQKELVINYLTLTHDREVYDNVHNTVSLIGAIGDVENTKESKDKIDAARSAYDALTAEEKALVDGYNNSYKTLEDDEYVYEALVLIDEIGQVGYDTDPEERIATAREYYDSLSDDQKAQVGELYLESLTKAERESEEITTINTTLLIIGLVVSSLIIGGGAYFIFFVLFKRRKDDDDDEGSNNPKGKKEPAKAMSLVGLLPGTMFIEHYFDAPWIVLYVIAPIAFLVLVACIVLYILKRKKKGPFVKKASPKEEAKVKEEPESGLEESMEKKEAEPSNEEEDESVTVTDEKGNIFQIRFVKSFTAKLIQAPEETKKYYEELKNEVLSYKKTNSRVSWHYDSVNSGRSQVLRFAIRGKTLAVYFPLNADAFRDSKYKVEKVESKKFEDTPCLYRIKNDRRCSYAKDLIAQVSVKLGLVKGEEKHESYVLPYEANKPLIERGLIKELKVQVKKPEEPVVIETKKTEDGDEIVRTRDSSGTLIEIRYVKSFTAKLSQGSDEVKDYYNLIKNHVLGYKGTHSRVSWHYDSVTIGREPVIKFAIRGKTLCVYYPLKEVDEKYKVEEAKGKKFEEFPCVYRIKNDRRSVYAKELIDIVMKKLRVEKGKESDKDFRIPYESTKALLEKGLIRELKTKVKESPKETHETITVEEADARMTDEAAASKIGLDDASKKHEGKKGIINIDTISKNFKDGDKVDLEALWAKKLVPETIGYVKVLARGSIDKRLDLDLQDYSIQAVKMVLLEGGTVKKAK